MRIDKMETRSKTIKHDHEVVLAGVRPIWIGFSESTEKRRKHSNGFPKRIIHKIENEHCNFCCVSLGL